MTFDPAPFLARPGVPELLAALKVEADGVRFVGGAVRDAILGAPVSDLDVATVFEPPRVIGYLEEAGIKAVPTGIEHGTITAVSKGTVVEVTTLRADVETDGRRATVAFTTDWAQDAARRDFTINALYADPRTGEVADFHGGLDDLAARRVRFIGDPHARIAEDHLRILRFFRFHARFAEGAPDADGLAACAEMANTLKSLSRERIADELLKLLALPDPHATVAVMQDHGIFDPVLPEIDAAGVERLRQLLAFEREAGRKFRPIRRLAALLPRDPDVAREVASRLKFSKEQRDRLSSAAVPAEGSARELAYRLGPLYAIDRIALTPWWESASGRSRADAVRYIERWEVPRLPVKGGDLIAMGLAPGPAVARTLRAIENEWIEHDFADDSAFDAIVERHLANARREA
ncbi:CCA tRNA nucleotidyltransferase [Sphingomicrobium astaxanthinifaciens]|uniref:CCA tRNA nucleotidyltransferase n=1 Tax=Sphingomicrobium astaxanthinifaciens TaxID=1227949 RepID=UPI001FCA72A3|nr:CCA tRNA nucleotidyltransferase [Sphingomicrobium astaxanthinifaciens]MCJ7420567.1 CCA tRNA nucleotidyltransferase [Sphingomicrobium astaxanthinifaciens]